MFFNSLPSVLYAQMVFRATWEDFGNTTKGEMKMSGDTTHSTYRHARLYCAIFSLCNDQRSSQQRHFLWCYRNLPKSHEIPFARKEQKVNN